MSTSTVTSDAVLLLETVHFAAEKHRNQRRKDPAQTPYINHPIGASLFLYFIVLPSGTDRKSLNSQEVEIRTVLDACGINFFLNIFNNTLQNTDLGV